MFNQNSKRMDPPPKVKVSPNLPYFPARILRNVPQMGKLAQRFNLNQGKRKHDEQAAAPDRSGKVSLLTSQSCPVQLPGSQLRRRHDASDVPMEPFPMIARSVDDPRTRHTPSFGSSSGLNSMNFSAPMVSQADSHFYEKDSSLLANKSTIIHSSCPWK